MRGPGFKSWGEPLFLKVSVSNEIGYKNEVGLRLNEHNLSTFLKLSY